MIEMEHRMTVVEDRCARNEGRIKELEKEHSALHQLATSVAVMAEQMKTMTGSVDALDKKVDALEKKPAKRWDAIVDKAVWALLSAGIAFLLGKMGII